MSAALSVRAVTRRFGGYTALKDVTVDIEAGGITAIIGPNGAGKSTLFNVLCGALRPSSGRVFLAGEDVTGLPQHRYARLGIAKSFQITSLFPSLSVLENVRIAVQARFGRLDLWTPRERRTEFVDRARAALSQVGLSEREARPAGTLAHGQQRSLEIAIALAADPRVLLLDEPTAGMSPEESFGMMGLIEALGAERTVVLVEHKMKLVMRVCRRIVVLHHGEVLARGTAEEIRDDPEVRRVYLGGVKP